MNERPILWTPSAARYSQSNMAAFERWLKVTHDLEFETYNEMWRWSITDLEAFWAAIWDFNGVIGTRPKRFLVQRQMPGAVWAPDARLNFAAQILSKNKEFGVAPALITSSETFGRSELSWSDLEAHVASVAHNLRRLGVKKGDRVAAILPNTETALIAFLASASIGAVWSLCALDMGHVAVLDRFQQIEPKVLILQDGYVHAGKTIDKRAVQAGIVVQLPSLEHVVNVPVIGEAASGHIEWSSLTEDDVPFDVTGLPFDHPLWIVYSSGTTGNPKPIVHGHGGITLELAKTGLHAAAQPGDRTCWLTSSGWIMWNAQWGSLMRGATVCLFDGAPNHPDLNTVWRFVDKEGVASFGAGAAFFDGCRKANVRPGELGLDALSHIGSTGSPLSADGYRWIYDAVKSDVWLAPISGGTDFAGAFVLGHPGMPVRAGEMQCRALGNAVKAFDVHGDDLIGEVGELVCTEPLPSMPLFFWGDEDGSILHDSYFDTYPGIWRHGDWIEITPDGGSVIYGRSDATINRKGLRLGSAEIYQAVEGLDAVADSLVVDLEFLGHDSFMPLFVVLADGLTLDHSLKEQINDAIRAGVSARFVPNEVHQIEEVPRTLSGKKLEVPVKKLLLGGDPGKVVNRDSMANPQSFEFFVEFAKARA
ncbi:MAG: acetoacetate--CoA ligase [Pseudomonadota bacterium]